MGHYGLIPQYFVNGLFMANIYRWSLFLSLVMRKVKPKKFLLTSLSSRFRKMGFSKNLNSKVVGNEGEKYQDREAKLKDFDWFCLLSFSAFLLSLSISLPNAQS